MLKFILGVFIGTYLGMFIMAMLKISGSESDRERKRGEKSNGNKFC